MSEKILNRYLGLMVFLVSAVVYIMTMGGTVSFWDSGEFIATSYILGIPHSPGTPLYVLVGRVFSLLPLGISVAQKVNLLSAVSAALGVLMAYISIVYVVRFMFGKATTVAGRIARYAGPLAGSMFLTFSDTYWTDASEAEVYALSSFVIGLCTVLALRWLKNPAGELGEDVRKSILEKTEGARGDVLVEKAEGAKKKDSRNLVLLIIYLLSLGIGFHLGTILVFGGIFIMFLMVRKKSFSNFELIAFTFGFAVIVADMTMHRQSTFTIIGLAVFAILIIWMTMSEGNFVLTATALFVLGISVHLFLYIRSGLDPAIDEVNPETWKALYAHLRREQYPAINVFERKASIPFQIDHFVRYFQNQFRLFGDYFVGRVNIGRLSSFIPLLLGLYGIMANYLREKKTWALNFTNLLLNSVGLIIFLNFSDQEVRERDYFYGGAFYLFAIFIGIGATSFLMLLLEQARKTAGDLKRFVVPAAIFILICSILPAGYQWHRHDRSEFFIPRDYAYNILCGLEPDAILFTNGDNDTFPLWYLQYVEGFRTDVRVANLSLLNTSWYIKQVRDTEPSIPLDLTDVEIERLRPIRVENGVLWTKDLAVNHIIRDVNWKRPIYFAVTVPGDVWDRYSGNLEMQGMVRRLIAGKGKFMVNDFMITRNLEEIFEFRGFLTEDWQRDDSQYRTREVENMFINFSVAAFQVAQNRAKDNLHGEAVKWAERSYVFGPRFEWPRKYLGIYYSRNRQYDKAEKHYLTLLAEEPSRGDYWVGLSSVYESMGDLERTVQTLEEASKSSLDHRDIFGHGFRISATLGRKEQAVSFVRRWLEGHPEDKEFQSLLDDIDRILQDEFGLGGSDDD
ncbi:MAG: DUF2723 domain-containing protein [Bacteroidales bacterium]|nr:DUF2723 domain-containing protein [Candidatus Latescibacterota bacterium]